MTLRAWMHTHDNRRKTIQKADVAAGAGKSEMFDFLIDILPRDDGQKVSRKIIKNKENFKEETGDCFEGGDQAQNVQYLLEVFSKYFRKITKIPPFSSIPTAPCPCPPCPTR